MKILLYVVLGYPVLWVLISSIMSLVTFVEYKVFKVEDHKFGLKGAIEFWWIVPGLLPVYLFSWIYYFLFNKRDKRKAKAKEEKQLNELCEQIRSITQDNPVNGYVLTNGGTEVSVYVIKETDYYTLAVYQNHSKILGVFRNIDRVIGLVRISQHIRYGGISFSQYVSQFQAVEEDDRKEQYQKG